MTNFIQVSALAIYPPSNLNRDDRNAPKTCQFGGYTRLRVSSQCLKRSYRTSEVFQNGGVADHIGSRSRRIGEDLRDALVDAGVDLKEAIQYTNQFIRHLGDPDIKVEKRLEEANKKKKDTEKQAAIDKFWSETDPNRMVGMSQLIYVSPEETKQLQGLIRESHGAKLEATDAKVKKKVKAILSGGCDAVDIAMFGRMFTGDAAKKANLNMEAAVSAAHALSVHTVAVESDYFSAVDDLNARTGESGSGHINDQGFASALFYLYFVINKDLLIKNLDGNVELANKAIANLIESIATVSPSGKQKSYGAYGHAEYLLVEKGEFQPRTLVGAFFKPVSRHEMLETAIACLRKQKQNMDQCYGRQIDSLEMVVSEGKGSLVELAQFAAK